METALVTRQEMDLSLLTDQAMDYAGQAKAPNTLRAYRVAWSTFTSWCSDHGRQPLPASAETVVLYVTAMADVVKVATLTQHLSAISVAHQTAGHETPTKAAAVRTVVQGIRRAKGTAQEAKAPAVTADLRAMVETLPEGILGVRDRALLLVGFAGAFRRSELVALDRDDLTITSEGITVTIRRSKTDQEGQGRKIGVPYGSNPATCPVRALLAWLEASGIESGPIFRGVNRHGQIQTERLSDRGVARVVQRQAEAAGLDSRLYGGHSLRAGLATSAAAAGVSERKIMDQTGHRSVQMVRRYIRAGSLFRDNAAGSVGL